MEVDPVTAEDREERQLSGDRTAQILERSRIGTTLFYVPILNPVWKNSTTPKRSINDAHVARLKKVMSKNIERTEPQYRRMRISIKLAGYERAVAHSVDKHAFWSGMPNGANLKTLTAEELDKSVSAPDEENEPVNAVIWQTMDELIQRCQHSVIHNVGVFVRLEAIRTEKHQNRYQPLQPYMDAEGFAKYSRPWKQILMFFARTQEAHEWESPQYEFTEQQSGAWQILLCEAQKIVAQRDESSNNNDSSDNSTDSDDGDSMNVLTDANKACLQFCYELLQQTITRKEYDSVLVCALAVLGVKSDGWMGVNQYPPMLSAIIKISRFMVVQQALVFEKDEELDSPKFV